MNDNDTDNDNAHNVEWIRLTPSWTQFIPGEPAPGNGRIMAPVHGSYA